MAETKEFESTAHLRDSGEASDHNAAEAGTMLVLAAGDNVGVVVRPVRAGGLLLASSGESVEPLENIPQGHKVALENLRTAAGVRKYGEIIGVTTREVRRGEHLHVHNAESQRLRGDLGPEWLARFGAHDAY